MYMERFTAFTVNLSNVERNLHKVKSKKMAEYGLRATHLMCMIKIYTTEEGLTPTELARSCAIDKAFVSRISADLMARELIEFNKNITDGRKYKNKYVLTDKGVAILEEITDIINEIISGIDSDITTEELKIFYKVLDTINTTINQTVDKI